MGIMKVTRMHNSITALKLALMESFTAIKSNFKLFLLALGFDIVLALLYGFISSAYLNKMNEYVYAIGHVALSAKGLRESSIMSLSSIFVNPDTTGYFWLIGLLLVLLVFSIYFTFSFLFGISTYTAFNISNFSKTDMLKFVKKFFWINIPWFIILAVYEIFSFYFFFVDNSQVRQSLNLEQSNFGFFGSLILLVIVYLMLVSFMLPGKRNFRSSVWQGIKNFWPLFFCYAMLVFVLLILHIIGTYIISLNIVAITFLYEIFIVLGFLLFARILLNSYLNKVDKI